MNAESSEQERRTRRRLDRGSIVDAALDYIDRHGTSQLSMRVLGQQLGVEAMSLYRYVRGREDLLEAVVSKLLESVGQNLDDQLSEHWQGYLQTLAHEMRGIAVDHPSAFPLVATRHPATPWLRPPLRSLELVETFITTLSHHGFTDEQIAETYRAFSSFLLGQLLLESAQRGGDTAPIDEPLDEGGATVPNEDGRVDLDGTPNVARLRPLLSDDLGLQEFETALETLLDRLDMMLTQ